MPLGGQLPCEIHLFLTSLQFNPKLVKRNCYICLILALVFTAACRKKELPLTAEPGPPALGSNESITISNAGNKSFYPLSTGISFDARIEGNAKDYSFLKGYIVDTIAKRTVATADVHTDGTMHFAFSPNEPDMYRLQVMAQSTLDTSEVIDGPVLDIYAGEPPAPDTVLLTPNDTSITVTWSKSSIPNFSAYKVFVSRTDTTLMLSDSLPGKLIATITDINDTSLVDNNTYFFYHYRYHVQVISDENLISLVEYATTPAGSYIGLSTAEVYFDETRNRFYSILSDGENSQTLVSMDPETLAVREMLPVSTDNRFYGLGENDSYFNIVKLTGIGVNNYQLYKLNLSTNVLEEKEQFSFGKGQIVAVFDNYIIYHGMTPGVPPYSYLAAYNLTTGEKTTFRTMSLPLVRTINQNTGFVVCSQDPAIRDTFHVYQMTPTGPAYVKSGVVHNIYISDRVFFGDGVVAVGGSLFDNDFNLLNNLPGQLVYRGLSRDGQYAVCSDNTIYRISDHTAVHTFGDGFPGVGYFSTDNDRMYFVAQTPLGGWLAPRLFRYPWK